MQASNICMRAAADWTAPVWPSGRKREIHTINAPARRPATLVVDKRPVICKTEGKSDIAWKKGKERLVA